MAEVVASTFLGVLFDKLASYFGGLSLDVDKELRKLQSTISTIQDVIDDAEERPVMEKAIKGWLLKLKDVAKDASDLLDKFAAEAGELRPGTEKVRSFFLKPNSIVFRHKVGRRIKEIMERLDEIAEEKSKFHLQESCCQRKEEIVLVPEETSPCDIELEVYGREEDRKKIVEFLINMSSGGDLGVLSIVGMGGLGKTTVAQLAYKDEMVCGHFEIKMWACVSFDFDIQSVYRSIIQYLRKSVDNLQDIYSLEQTLITNIRGKRYLLVLDDVWNENAEKWNRLRNLLRCGAKGSKIIVTTRSENVASIMGTVPHHFLASLSEDECWALFEKRAFGLGGSNKTPNLVSIGHDIVKKCGGIPLAAIAIGSLLRWKKEESEWLAVKECHNDWEIPNDENEILPALMMSYNYLPSRLKECFAYCSIFPKGCHIQKEELVRLWIAQGLIPLSSEENTNLGDIGFQYLDELISRSFLQHDPEDDVLKSVQMHELIYELAQYVAGKECSIVDASNPRGQKRLANSSTAHLSTSQDQSKDKSTSTEPPKKRKERHFGAPKLMQSSIAAAHQSSIVRTSKTGADKPEEIARAKADPSTEKEEGEEEPIIHAKRRQTTRPGLTLTEIVAPSPTNKRDALANTLPLVTVNTGKRLKRTVEEVLHPEPISLSDSNVDAIYQMADDLVKAVDSLSSSSLSLELQGPLKQDYLRFLDLLEVPFDHLVQRHSSELIACIVSLSAAPVGFFTAQQQQLLSEMNQQLRAKISQALSYQEEIWARTAFINSAKELLDSSISPNREKDAKLRHEDAILAKEEAELKDRLQRIKEERSKIEHERKKLLSRTKEALAKTESDGKTLVAVSEDIKEAQHSLKLMSIEWNVFKLSITKF